MAFGIPSDLIRQVQTLIREEVGLSSYDPLDPALPTVPSLRESIASFDQSAPSLRCYHCKGNLLRGLQSSICVYCGKFQPKDVLPDPINFKSTCGYNWLLHSLDLNGSETVISSIEESELSRRRTSKKEVILSDLLDLKITFSAASNKDDISLPEDEALQNKLSLDVSGNEFDNFFPESRQESGFHAFEEHQVEGKQVGIIENIDQVNLQTEKLAQFKKEESFSGWEADFQFADSGNQHETSTSSISEPQLSSQADLSAHLDSVFGSSKELYKGNSATGDWTQDDSWNYAKDASSMHMKDEGKVNTAIQSGDGSIVDWFTNEQQQAGTINEPENTWGDFADFTSTQYKRTGDQIDVVAAAQQESERDFVDSINGWSDFAAEQKEEINFVRTDNAQGVFGPGSSNTQFPHTEKDIYSNTVNTTTTTAGEQEDGSLDDMWDDFTSSTVIDQPSGDHIAGFPEQRDEINSVRTINNQEMSFDIFSASDRSNAVDFGVVENKNSKEEDEIEDVNNLSKSREVDIGASLMSQMHDLSFMLKDELSIP
ncbi:uncharacterized protein LOC124937865 [Impatiens glandulifera]|uniref:uncharacterized protein LOC124937865 n=1 Tax=Impatiens glandulifera TaxID=253017 RepID=UPI001FB0BDF2|nr:uncharacterized protein LOC124937865 [Impatiens glandulifera]